MNKKTLKNQVYSILRDIPESRNSDITLLIELWNRYYPQFIINSDTSGQLIRLKDLFDLPQQDAIKRIRAGIQNNDREYLPTDIKVLIGRAIQSDEWKKFLGYRVNKYPTALTHSDIEKALTEYINTPDQKALF